MNKIVKISTLCLLLLGLSCSNKKKQNPQSDVKTLSDSIEPKETRVAKNQINNTTDVYFRGSGTESFWS